MKEPHSEGVAIHADLESCASVWAGWSNYFSQGTRLLANRAVDNHVQERVRGFLPRRRKVSSRDARQVSGQVLFGKSGVVRLRRIHLGPPPATA